MLKKLELYYITTEYVDFNWIFVSYIAIILKKNPALH